MLRLFSGEKRFDDEIDITTFPAILYNDFDFLWSLCLTGIQFMFPWSCIFVEGVTLGISLSGTVEALIKLLLSLRREMIAFADSNS
jgi:hypothetical protein